MFHKGNRAAQVPSARRLVRHRQGRLLNHGHPLHRPLRNPRERWTMTDRRTVSWNCYYVDRNYVHDTSHEGKNITFGEYLFLSEISVNPDKYPLSNWLIAVGTGTAAEDSDDGESIAQYVSTNCVVFTHYRGDAASEVEEHFQRALAHDKPKGELSKTR